MKRYVLFALCPVVAGCSFFLKTDDPNKVSAREVKVHYVSPLHEEVNSFEGYLKKQTRPLHYAETKFDFDQSQQIFILNRAFLTKFFDLPPTLTVPSASKDTNSLRIASGVLDWTVKWTGSRDELRATGSRLPEFLDFLDSTIHASKEYKQLPKSES